MCIYVEPFYLKDNQSALQGCHIHSLNLLQELKNVKLTICFKAVG